jgi:hypothetical protein
MSLSAAETGNRSAAREQLAQCCGDRQPQRSTRTTIPHSQDQYLHNLLGGGHGAQSDWRVQTEGGTSALHCVKKY